MATTVQLVEDGALLLVGNPNVGKSALFGHLTGKYVAVSNYPGTTVEVTKGRQRSSSDHVEVVDTPGIYSLQPQSEDEIVTRNILLASRGARVILVVDAKNLARGLVVAQQLCELGLPFCIALNMMDEALSQGMRIDVAALERVVGVPVVPTVATSGRGIDELQRAVALARPGLLRLRLPDEFEWAVSGVAAILNRAAGQPVPDFVALSTLVDRRTLSPELEATLSHQDLQQLETIGREVRQSFRTPLPATLSRMRRNELNSLLADIVQRPARPAGSLATRLGYICVHPVWGLAVAILTLVLMYGFVGRLGAGVLVGLLEDGLFARVVNPAVSAVADLLPWAFAREFLVGDYGLVTMALTYSLAIILPVVTTFFLAFRALEDSGLMPRLAVMSNNLFRRLGLHGKAVLPLILGLGCDTMATLTARIMDTRKERILVTFLLALGVPCSAQLGVILGMLGAVSWAGVVVWLGVVILVFGASGAIAARVLPGPRSDFILELPPLRTPGLRNILVKTAARVEWYLREAVPLFILGTVLLFALDRMQWLGWIRDGAAPVVQHFLGLPAAATDAFLVGFLRRDYGAAGLYEIQRTGLMDGRQIVVSLVIITLFVPCIANFFVMIKERGLRSALVMGVLVMVIALSVGGALNGLLRLVGAEL